MRDQSQFAFAIMLDNLKMKKFWMPLHFGEYLANTSHLNTAEHGAYLLLMIHYWIKGGLPKNEDAIRRITRMTTRQWAQSRDVIKSLFDEDWRHARLDEELCRALEISKVNSANAKRSHANRNRSATGVEQGSQAESQSHLEPHSHAEELQQSQPQFNSSGDEAAGGPPPVYCRDYEQVKFSSEVRDLATQLGEVVGTYSDMGQASQRWLDRGWRTDLIVFAVKTVMAKRAGKGPPRSLKYFEQAIQEAHAEFAPHLLAGFGGMQVN